MAASYSLNGAVAAYLQQNGIAFSPADYATGHPEGQADQIIEWNTDKLGPQPSQAQIDAAWAAYVAAAAAEADMALQCTRSQFKLAALELGKLDAIEAFIAASGDRALQIRWNEAPTFFRSFEGWDAMAGMIGETPESVTALFKLAVTK